MIITFIYGCSPIGQLRANTKTHTATWRPIRFLRPIYFPIWGAHRAASAIKSFFCNRITISAIFLYPCTTATRPIGAGRNLREDIRRRESFPHHILLDMHFLRPYISPSISSPGVGPGAGTLSGSLDVFAVISAEWGFVSPTTFRDAWV